MLKEVTVETNLAKTEVRFENKVCNSNLYVVLWLAIFFIQNEMLKHMITDGTARLVERIIGLEKKQHTLFCQKLRLMSYIVQGLVQDQKGDFQ